MLYIHVADQLGNMISAASAQIEATAGEKITNAAGLPDYGTVSAILLGTVIGMSLLSAWLPTFSCSAAKY